MNPVKLPSIVVIFFCAIFMLFFLHQAQAEVPKLINYQGKLTTPQGAPLDTTVSMQFSIYSDSTGGDPLWSEIQMSVKVDKGIFNILLGSVNEIPESVFTGDIRYLGVKVGADPEMTPRKAIVSVPYSMRSVNADTAKYLGIWPPPGKVYDSGWFEVQTRQYYTLVHNLGTTRVITELWFSTSPSGSSAIRINTMSRSQDDGSTASVQWLTPTQITVATGYGSLAAIYGNGWVTYYNSGYYRLILLALE